MLINNPFFSDGFLCVWVQSEFQELGNDWDSFSLIQFNGLADYVEDVLDVLGKGGDLGHIEAPTD